MAPADFYEWIKVAAFIFGLIFGGFAVFSPSWVYFRRDLLTVWAVVLAALGTTMIGMSIWQSVVIEGPGFSARFAELEEHNRQLQAQLDSNKKQLAELKESGVTTVASVDAARLQAEISQQLRAEVSQQLRAEVSQQLRTEVSQQLYEEVSRELYATVSRQLRADVSKLLEAEVSEKFTQGWMGIEKRFSEIQDSLNKLGKAGALASYVSFKSAKHPDWASAYLSEAQTEFNSVAEKYGKGVFPIGPKQPN